MAVTQKTPATIAHQLLDTRCYPDRPSRVEEVATHISRVFLTDRYAYKLKKPVQFEFVDFSTLEARRVACVDELRLNRRLAPDVYLKVLPVCKDALGQVIVGGDGVPVDWVVRMRRLAADRTLEHLIKHGRLSKNEVDKVARMLANFYGQAVPLTIRPQQYRAEIEHHIRANADELSSHQHAMDPVAVRRVHAAQLRMLALAPELLDRRVCDGYIVEGHGDLRPEHIYVERTPVVIDCVEFSAELRTLDIADELSFLAMECDRLGAPEVGNRILDVYQQFSGDRPPPVLIKFYKAYRACVRAKVSILRSDQVQSAGNLRRAAAEYLQLADGYLRRRLGRPLLVVVRGLMGVGKSTLANALSQKLEAELFSTDHIRHVLQGVPRTSPRYASGIYQENKRSEVYEELFRRAQGALRSRLSVVLDGTYLRADARRRCLELAQGMGAEFLMVECQCSGELARRRIAERLSAGTSNSDARPDMYQQQAAENERDPPGISSLVIDTTQSIGAQVNLILPRIAQTLLGSTS